MDLFWMDFSLENLVGYKYTVLFNPDSMHMNI